MNAPEDAKKERIGVILNEAVLVCTYEHPNVASLECLVCKLHLEECCLDCRVRKGDCMENNCQVVKGACDHVFHEHCIHSWCRQRRECPACFKEWIAAAYVDVS